LDERFSNGVLKVGLKKNTLFCLPILHLVWRDKRCFRDVLAKKVSFLLFFLELSSLNY